MTRKLQLRDSLRWRLPLLISLPIAAVLGVFLWLSYQGVRRTLVETAGTRATEAANQVAGMLAQSSQQRRTEMLRVAGDPAVREYLAHPGGDATAARARLATLALPNGVQRIELWTAAGERRLGLALPPDAAASLPDGVPPSVASPKPLRVHDNKIFSEVFVPVDLQADGAPPARAAAGYIVVRRPLAAAGSDALNRLIGTGAAIEIGNKGDDVWTNLAARVPPPAVDLGRPGVAQYRAAPSGRRLGALADVRGTLWAVWLDFPEANVLAPARRFLQRMTAVAIACVAVAALMTAFMSARITTPLGALTDASEAIAAGDYDRRVDAGRRDEIGRLVTSFNAMAAQVGSMHRDLEARVQERTASLTDAMQQLESANAELEAFSYSVSHDLRAPLRHVTGFAALLEQRASASLDDEARRHVKTIVEAAGRMGRLIDDLLAFSRVGRTKLAMRPVDLGELVRDAQREVAPAINGRQVAWTVHSLPCVQGDPAMLRQVLTNLISNAVKYTSTRPVAAIEVGAEAGAGGEVVVRVRDNGVGFDPRYAHKLFGVFQRLHSADQFDGTGIGLANVKRIVHRHGGRTWAEGRVDGGATFYFSLPAVGN